MGSASVGSDRAGDLWSDGTGGAAATINQKTAMGIAAFYCGVQLISNAIKKLPLRVMRIAEFGREPATDHPAFPILRYRPNPIMRPATWKKLLERWVLTWGNAYAEIERTRDGVPLALWPVHPSRVKTLWVRDRGSPNVVTYQVHAESGGIIEIAPENMLHVFSDTDDGVVGISRIGLARRSLGLTVSAEEYGARFFDNYAMPKVVVTGDEPLTDEFLAKAKESWITAYGGEKKHGVAMLGAKGIKITPMSLQNNDAQFLETREHQVEEVARWLNVPPHKLKDLRRATFSNITEQRLEFDEDAIEPDIKEIEEECERKLLTEAERATYSIRFQMQALLRADIKTRADVLDLRIKNGTISADEVRALEDENEMPDEQGKLYLVPTNMQSASELVAKQARLSARLGNDADEAFLREVLKIYAADATIGDAVFNQTQLRTLMQRVGVPLEPDSVEPLLPIVAQTGPLVSGEAKVNTAGEIVGGDIDAAAEPPAADENEVEPPEADETTDNRPPPPNEPPPEEQAAYRQWLGATLERLGVKERKAWERASRDAGRFDAWRTDWFEAHAATVRIEIGRVFDACAEADLGAEVVSDATADIARDYCILRRSHATPAGLQPLDYGAMAATMLNRLRGAAYG